MSTFKVSTTRQPGSHSRYHVLEALEDASQPPVPPPASDPSPGEVAASVNFEIVAEVVESLIIMAPAERAAVAKELAEYDRDLSDQFAGMLLDAGYEHSHAATLKRMVTSALTVEPLGVGDYVEEMDD